MSGYQRTAISVAALLGSVAAVLAAAPDWPYERDFDNRLLLLHPLVNYAVHPDQQAAWDRDRLIGSVFLATIGSVHTEELMIDAKWAVNAPLARGLRFRNDITWRETRHLPFRRRDIWLGLEGRVSGPLAIVVQAQPAYDKEELDVRAGGIWSGRGRQAQVLFVREDLVFDEKNDLGGRTDRAATGIDWVVRQELGRWTLASSGRWLRASRHSYPDSLRSPDLRRDGRRDNELRASLRYAPRPRTTLEAAWELNEFAAQRDDRAGAYDHAYAGRLLHLSLRAVTPVADRWRLRGELHAARLRAGATGWRAFDYRREETMAALWGEWRWGDRHRLEAGYLNTWCRWRYAGEPPARERADKIALALHLGFASDAALTFSLSHELNLQRFGGISVQIFTPL